MNTLDRIRARTAAAIAASLIGSACGGGSGDSTLGGTAPSDNLSTAPGDAAYSAYLQSNQQYSLSTVDSAGDTLVLNISVVPSAGTTIFNGITVNSSLSTVSLSDNGTLVASDTTTNYFTLSPYTAVGSVDESGSPFVIYSNNAAIPDTLTAGASPVGLDTGIEYHDSSTSLIDANISDSFYTVINDATSLLFCINSVTTNVSAQGTTDGLANGVETDCYTDDAAGNMSLLSITLIVDGETLTFM